MRRALLSLLALAASAAALFAAAPEARADGFLVPLEARRPVRRDWAVTHHRVDVDVRGQKAHVRVDQEFVNLAHQKNAQGLMMFGFNGDPIEQTKQDNPIYHMLERYWGDTLAFLARIMFDEEARIERHTTFVAATEDVHIPAMTLAKGRTAAIRHLLTASISGQPRLTVDEYLYHTPKNRPHPYVDAADFYEVEIEGRPSSVMMRMALKASLARDLDFWPGDPTPQAWYATATPMLQSIPAVLRAEPGLMLPEVPRHFVQDIKKYLTMPELVRQELHRLGITP